MKISESSSPEREWHAHPSRSGDQHSPPASDVSDRQRKAGNNAIVNRKIRFLQPDSLGNAARFLLFTLIFVALQWTRLPDHPLPDAGPITSALFSVDRLISAIDPAPRETLLDPESEEPSTEQLDLESTSLESEKLTLLQGSVSAPPTPEQLAKLFPARTEVLASRISSPVMDSRSTLLETTSSVTSLLDSLSNDNLPPDQDQGLRSTEVLVQNEGQDTSALHEMVVQEWAGISDEYVDGSIPQVVFRIHDKHTSLNSYASLRKWILLAVDTSDSTSPKILTQITGTIFTNISIFELDKYSKRCIYISNSSDYDNQVSQLSQDYGIETDEIQLMYALPKSEAYLLLEAQRSAIESDGRKLEDAAQTFMNIKLAGLNSYSFECTNIIYKEDLNNNASKLP